MGGPLRGCQRDSRICSIAVQGLSYPHLTQLSADFKDKIYANLSFLVKNSLHTHCYYGHFQLECPSSLPSSLSFLLVPSCQFLFLAGNIQRTALPEENDHSPQPLTFTTGRCSPDGIPFLSRLSVGSSTHCWGSWGS